MLCKGGWVPSGHENLNFIKFFTSSGLFLGRLFSVGSQIETQYEVNKYFDQSFYERHN